MNLILEMFLKIAHSKRKCCQILNNLKWGGKTDNGNTSIWGKHSIWKELVSSGMMQQAPQKELVHHASFIKFSRSSWYFETTIPTKMLFCTCC